MRLHAIAAQHGGRVAKGSYTLGTLAFGIRWEDCSVFKSVSHQESPQRSQSHMLLR